MPDMTNSTASQTPVTEAEYPWLAHYEKGVPAVVELPDERIFDALDRAVREFPDKIAVRLVLKYLPFGIAIHSKLTYRELDDYVIRFAAALRTLGVKKGDRIAIMLPNLPQYIIAYYGALKLGAIVVNTNPTYTSRELRYQLEDSGAETIVMLSGLYERLAEIREHTAVRNVILTDVPDTLGWPFNKLVERQVRKTGMMANVPARPGLHRFYPLLAAQTATLPQVAIEPDDVVIFQYTGGTTGVPKASMLTHRNLTANVRQMLVWFQTAEYGREKMLGALPCFHVYGMSVGMLLSGALGAELVLIPDPRNTKHVLQTLQNERITLFPGVPALYNVLINYPDVDKFDLHSVKACLSGGSSLPEAVARRFGEITGGRLVEGYGLTEASPLVTANPLFGNVRIGSIGLPVPSTRVEIVSLEPDADGKFQPVPVGEEGELIVYGPQVMKGYWNQPEETALVFTDDGGLHTGDIARVDEDGYFYIVDRKKDLIIASGYSVVPREVEEVLFTHPKVADAAVAGVHHPKRGETVKAFLVLKEGESTTVDEIRSFCRESLAPYKVPTLVEFRDELPKTQVGKVLRRQLVEEHNQSEQAMDDDEASSSEQSAQDGQAPDARGGVADTDSDGQTDSQTTEQTEQR
jgi:long-chain acyl-CoA synthetase